MNNLIYDIGGHVIRYSIMDDQGNILYEDRIPTAQERRDVFLNQLISIFEAQDNIKAISLSMPGIINPETGYIKMGGALRYNDDTNIKEDLEAACHVPVIVENNAKCAALAELSQGSLQDINDGMALYFDKMIGGTLIRNHQIVRGPHFSSGEVAYVITVRNDMPDFDTVWGNRCGLPRLCKMYARVSRKKEDQVTFAMVMEAVDRGDTDAIACLDTFTREIAVQIFNLQTILDVERFAIGGKASLYPTFIKAIKTNLLELYMVCPYEIPQADLVACTFKEDASLFGAYYNLQSK